MSAISRVDTENFRYQLNMENYQMLCSFLIMFPHRIHSHQYFISSLFNQNIVHSHSYEFFLFE